MPPYDYDSEYGAFVKHCPRCNTNFIATKDETESEKILTKYFSCDKMTTDGFVGHCKSCVAYRNQARRAGREDCCPIELLAAQDSKCAICTMELSLARRAHTQVKAHVDHNHETGKVRGMLCRRCNMMLGFLESRPDWIELAKAYLKKYQEQQ